MQYFICLPACHVTINQHQRTVNMAAYCWPKKKVPGLLHLVTMFYAVYMYMNIMYDIM